MAMSTADYFRMMQGGVDRTGYADMMPDRIEKKESIEDRLAKLMAQSDDNEDTLPEDMPPEETGELSFGSMFDDYIPESILNMPAEDMSKMDELAAMGIEAKFDANRGVKNVSTPKVSSTGVPKTGTVAIGEEFKPKSFSADLLKFFKKSPLGLALIPTELGAADFPLDDEGMPIYPDEFAMADGGRVNRYMGGMSDAQRKSGGSTHSGGPSQGPDNNKNNPMGPGLNTPVDPIKSTYTPMKQPSLIDQVKKYNFLQGVYGDEDDGLSFGYDINPYAQEASANLSYSFEDGGRVGMQAGGLPPLPPLPQYTQPTFGYDTIFPGVGIPEYNPIEKPITPVDTPEPQAYNPYVSTMPLYDPSTLGTGLPSTVGATDPYMMYDPYAPVGAFSRPPSESIGFLTEEEIKKGFEDMDRFDLQAQQAKKKAAEEAAKKTAQQKLKLAEKGGGGGPNNS